MNDLLSADRVGTVMPCPHCHGEHVIEQPYVDRTTAERKHLYLACQGQRFFVGIVQENEAEPR